MFTKRKVVVANFAKVSFQNISRLLTCVLIMLTLAGCAHFPIASEEEDRSAKSFTPDPDNGSIYILGVWKSFGFAADAKSPVKIDGQMIGFIGAKTFFYIKVPPGLHDISTRGVETFDNLNRELLFSVEVEKGKVYFVELTIPKMASHAAKLLIVDEEVGKKEALSSKLLNIQIEKGPKMFQ